jgi:hypothetical protein
VESFYYLAMLIGVAWLCIWSILPEQYRNRFWWPFDMADDDERGGKSADGGGRAARRGAVPAETAPAADLQHALPEPRPAQSWRVRREQASPSRRRR